MSPSVFPWVAIERARFGDERLSVAVEIDSSARQQVVPALLLQPLVENAVKHGVSSRPGPGAVRITARLVQDRLEIKVEDSGRGERRPVEPQGTGIALDTLRKRLAHRYGASAGLSLEPTADGMIATVTLPAVDQTRKAA